MSMICSGELAAGKDDTQHGIVGFFQEEKGSEG